jgi:hypothetical protein
LVPPIIHGATKLSAVTPIPICFSQSARLAKHFFKLIVPSKFVTNAQFK